MARWEPFFLVRCDVSTRRGPMTSWRKLGSSFGRAGQPGCRCLVAADAKRAPFRRRHPEVDKPWPQRRSLPRNRLTSRPRAAQRRCFAGARQLCSGPRSLCAHLLNGVSRPAECDVAGFGWRPRAHGALRRGSMALAHRLLQRTKQASQGRARPALEDDPGGSAVSAWPTARPSSAGRMPAALRPLPRTFCIWCSSKPDYRFPCKH